MDRLATSTNIISFRRDGGKVPMVELIPRLAMAGWKNLDLNFCEMMNPDSPLRTDAWREYVGRLAELKAGFGLNYMQSHAPYEYDRFAMEDAAGKASDELIQRAIVASADLGISRIVVHPAKGHGEEPASTVREKNIRWLSPFVELAEETGISIALENLDAPGEIREAEELCLLVDTLASASVGVCYDFGHAHLGGQDHVRNLRSYGRRLIATHVADNHGKTDEHLLPFYGTIPWEDCMRTLSEIGYTGYLTYEVMFFTQYLPEELKPSMLRHARNIGNYLCGMMENPSDAERPL